MLAVVTDSTPKVGVVPRRGEGVCNSPHRGGDAQRAEGVLHATRRAEGSCNCRKYGDYDVEDLAPEVVVVECSHSKIIG